MSKIVLALSLAALAVGAARGGDDPEPPSKAKGIQGVWAFDKVIGDKDKGGPPPGGLTLTFAKDKMSVSIMNQVEKGHTFKIDAKKKPAHLDVTDKDGKTVLGIYKIEKDKLYVCIGERTGKRPTAFDGKDEMVLVLKRQKK